MDYEIITRLPCKIELDSTLTLRKTPSIQSEIDYTWDEETQKNKKLFNGKILNVSEVKTHQNMCFIRTHWIDYKDLIAQTVGNLELGIKTLSVSGITQSHKNEILMGKRHQTHLYPNYWECVPAGNIDPNLCLNNEILPQEQLITEFEEETGVSKNNISNITYLCLIFDPELQAFDICYEIHLSSADLKLKTNSEYVKFQWIKRSEINHWLESNTDKKVPTSVALLKLI